MSFTKIQYVDNETIITAANLNAIQDEILNVANYIYPVGSIYMSFDNTSPAYLFGGSWEQIQETFLFASGNISTVGTTGGYTAHNHTTAEYTLTENQIPLHSHLVPKQELHKGTQDNNDSNNLNYGVEGSLSGWGVARASTNNQGSARMEIQAHWTNSTGGSQPHTHGDTGISSSMPPYLVVNMWKRIA